MNSKKRIKLAVCQQLPMNRDEISTFLETYLADEVQLYKPDFIVFPEYIVNDKPREISRDNDYLAAVSKIVAKYEVHVILGSMVELEPTTGKRYNTSVIFGPSGDIIGTYRKRKLSGETSLTPGECSGIFQTEFGNIAILICLDSEDDTLLKETMQQEPRFIFIPIDIILPNFYAQSPELLVASWKSAMKEMSDRFWPFASNHNACFVRADRPFYISPDGLNYGTSMVVKPYHLLFAPTIENCIIHTFLEEKKIEHYKKFKVTTEEEEDALLFPDERRSLDP
nr:carbon-nitrogen hydrolase family protein [Candidatus Sigynarchaeota archaeon]